MAVINSYYLYQRYEKRGNQPWIPSYPNTWSIDGDGTMPIVLKEQDDPSCYHPIYRWVQTEDTICVDTTTIEVRTTSGDPYCQGYDKYVDTTTEQSFDSGITWQFVSSSSTLVEQDSEYCGYHPTPEVQYRWTESGTTCDNANKYKRYIKEVSYDGGYVWIVVTPPQYSAGTIVEADSYECGYRTSTTSSSTYCNGDDLYVDVYYRVSRDYGTTWITASTTPTLVEVGGCATPSTDGKFKLTLSDSSTVSAECDSTSAITESEVSIPYKNTLVSAEIGNCVTSIGAWTFDSCTGLTSVTIPDSVTSIDSGAFWNCSRLTSVNIPSGVTNIGGSAFNGCRSLTSITIPDTVTSIDSGVFYDCLSLTSITIPNSVASIGGSAFRNCSGLTSITVNATTPPTLGSGVFEGSTCQIYVPCASVETYKAASGWSTYASRIEGIPPCGQPTPSGNKFTLTLSDSSTVTAACDSTSAVTSGEVSSQYSGTVVSAEISDCVTSIQSRTFYRCSNLISVTIPDSVTSIGYGAFGDDGNLANVEIPSGVTSIGQNAFRECESLTHITIPDSVITIGSGAFYSCGSLSSVTIGNSLTSIGGTAFMQCGNLVSVNIPSSMTSIDDSVFRDCYGLRSVGLADSNPSVVLPSTLVSIGGHAFQNCIGLSSVTIPDSVTTIGEWCFQNCTGITSIDVGNGVTSINERAFNQCNILTSLTIRATTPPTLGQDALKNTNNCQILVPSQSVNAYKQASGWSDFSSRIQPIT